MRTSPPAAPAPVLEPRRFDFSTEAERVAELILDAHRAGRIKPSQWTPDALLEAAGEADVDQPFNLDLTLVDAARVLTDLDLVDEPALAERFAGWSQDGPCGDVMAMARHAVALEGARLALGRINGAPVAAPATSLEAFAARVNEIARQCPGAGPYAATGEKVYIGDVFDRAQDLGLDEAGFKALLVAANQAGMLSLSRADPTPAFDEGALRRSFTTFAGAAFHLIRVQPVRAPRCGERRLAVLEIVRLWPFPDSGDELVAVDPPARPAPLPRTGRQGRPARRKP